MVWNHRVVKRERIRGDGTVETTYQIHEAYYDKKGAPADSITLEPVAPLGETVEELREELQRMLRALEHTALNYEDF